MHLASRPSSDAGCLVEGRLSKERRRTRPCGLRGRGIRRAAWDIEYSSLQLAPVWRRLLPGESQAIRGGTPPRPSRARRNAEPLRQEKWWSRSDVELVPGARKRSEGP